MIMMSPDDPRLPKAWQKQPTYCYQIATLVNSEDLLSPDDTIEFLEYLEPDEIKLQQVFPGWLISHDYSADEFDPLMDADSPEDTERVLSELESLQRGYFDEALQDMKEFIQNNDFRRAEGWLAQLFAGKQSGYMTPEQRQALMAQLESTPLLRTDQNVLRQAFLELGQGVAIGAVLWQEIEHAYLETRFESPNNPVLTLIGREVVCEYFDDDEVTVRGVLQLLDGNTLSIGDWQQDFSGAEVGGTPFQDVEIDLEADLYTITEAEFYDLVHDDSDLDFDDDE
jgi:hypothetical protein